MADLEVETSDSELGKEFTLEQLEPHFPSLDLDRFLARGGMGAVYRAVQRELDRDVALKLISHEWDLKKELFDMFRREARAMAKLSHPNLVPVYDFGTVEELGVVYFLMEYVHGEMLDSYLRRTKLDAEAVLSLMGEVADAISYAHEEGVCHHDIKPANVMVTPKGKVKVLDFGLARLANETMAEEGERYGTPDYAAPEVYYVDGNPDHRADIFALGTMLYELLVGVVPDEEAEAASRMAGTPKYLDTVIAKSRAEEPKNRYQSVAEWREAILPSKERVSANSRGSRPAGKVSASGPVRVGGSGGRVQIREGRRTAAVQKAARERSAAPKRQGSSISVLPWLLLLAVLGFAGFFGWQQWKRSQNSDPDEGAAVAGVKPSENDPGGPSAPAVDPKRDPLSINPLPASVPDSPSPLDLPLEPLPGAPATAALGGPLDSEEPGEFRLAARSFTTAFTFRAEAVPAGQAKTIFEIGGAEAGFGAFLVEIGGGLKVVLAGARSDQESFGLAQAVEAGEEVTLFVSQVPGASGAKVSLRLAGGEPIVKQTQSQNWVDSDPVNGFGSAAGKEPAEVGGAAVFFGPPFEFPAGGAPISPYPGEVDFRFYQGGDPGGA